MNRYLNEKSEGFLETKLNKKSNTEQEIEIIIPWSEVGKDYEKYFNNYSKKIQIKGFRSGKVPKAIVEKQYGSAIEWEFIKENFWEYYSKAIKKEKIKPINQPQISDVDFQKGKQLSVTFQFQILPEWELPKYKDGFKINKDYYKFTDKDIDGAILELQRKIAKEKDTKAPAKNGDHIIGESQKVNKDDKPIGEIQKIDIIVGEGFASGKPGKKLEGINIGEARIIEIVDTKDKKIINKYSITPTSIKEYDLPKLDIDFFQKINPDVKTLNELKKDAKINLEKYWDKQVNDTVKENISDYFVDELSELELPSDMVNDYLDRVFEDEKQRNPEIKDEYRDSYKKNMNVMGQKIIKWALVKNKIIANEKIEANDDDIQKKIDELLEPMKDEEQLDMYKKYYESKEVKNNLKEQIVEEKLMEHIKEFVKYKKNKVDNIF